MLVLDDWSYKITSDLFKKQPSGAYLGQLTASVVKEGLHNPVSGALQG
jgi:hypothetical protein